MQLYISYGKRKIRGGFKESLETSQRISYSEFIESLSRFHFAAFDERTNQIMFLANELENEEFGWIFIQIDDVPDTPTR